MSLPHNLGTLYSVSFKEQYLYVDQTLLQNRRMVSRFCSGNGRTLVIEGEEDVGNENDTCSAMTLFARQ